MQVPQSHYYATIFEGWQFPDALLAQQEFRKRLFVDELSWDLEHEDGIEFDEFDTHSAVYCSLYLNNEIVGCWRAVRTSEEYLGKKIFPDLADLRPYPSHRDIWEISRLGVIRHPERALSAQYTYALMFYFAVSRNARSLCGVVSPIHNRNIVISGIKTDGYGKPAIVGHDLKGRPIRVFFGEIPMRKQDEKSLARVLDRINQLDLQDESLVFRRNSISA